MLLLVLVTQAVITERYGSHGCNVGEDGGFTPNISRLVLSSGSSVDLDWFLMFFNLQLERRLGFCEGGHWKNRIQRENKDSNRCCCH